MYFLVTLYILFYLCVLYTAYINRLEPYSSPIEIVVARYEESLEWLKEEPFNLCSIKIYNKGAPIEYSSTPLPNLGRCDHTYLYHIVNSYDNLAPVTVFLPASCSDRYKQERAKKTCQIALKTNTSLFFGHQYKPNVRDQLYYFKLDTWKATNQANLAANPEQQLQLAEIRPFGAWYDAHFPGIQTQVVCYYGIFAVSRDHIRQHPKAYYHALLDQLSVGSNPEVGHYMERSWGALFNHIQKHVSIFPNS